MKTLASMAVNRQLAANQGTSLTRRGQQKAWENPPLVLVKPNSRKLRKPPRLQGDNACYLLGYN